MLFTVKSLMRSTQLLENLVRFFLRFRFFLYACFSLVNNILKDPTYLPIYFLNDLITCSWHQKTKPRILQLTNLKCCIKVRGPPKTPFFNGALFLIYQFEKYSKPCFFILKTFCSTLNSWIGELENSWFRFLMSPTG